VLDSVLLVVGFAMLVSGALVFTNAVEWAGIRLDLGHGAVGSVLAAVATAMPESLVPVVAITRGEQGDPIAIGAILGAPFLLGTLAMALCGAAALIYRVRRQGTGLRLDRHAMSRDLLVFVGTLSIAIVIGNIHARPVHVIGAFLLVVAYGAYLTTTIVRARRQGGEDEPPGPLYFDRTGNAPPRTHRILAQAVVGVGLLVGGAEVFVTVIEHLARAIGINALALTLLVAPLATELPEKINSVLWIRQGKDTLALGNITGAMVFQSMLPVAVGMAFTDWHLTAPARVAAIAALGGATLAVIAVRRTGRFSAPFIGCWAGLYAGAIASIIALT
jgi:cation:H+ antiporter